MAMGNKIGSKRTKILKVGIVVQYFQSQRNLCESLDSRDGLGITIYSRESLCL